MIQYPRTYRNTQIKREPPSIAEIPDLWRESVALESLASPGLRGGLARARTRLLDNIPPWQIPQILDQLQEVTA